MFYAKYLSARGPLVKYPANKVNPYLDKVISAQRANVKWLCEEQFCATLILKKSFSGSCSDDFRGKVLANLSQFLLSLCSDSCTLLKWKHLSSWLCLSKLLRKSLYEIASGLYAHKVTSRSNLIGPLHCASTITIAIIIASFSEQQLQLLYSRA